MLAHLRDTLSSLIFIAWSSIAQLVCEWVFSLRVIWCIRLSGFEACIQQGKTTCLLPIRKSFACARASQDVQRTTAPSAGQDHKMRTLAACGYFSGPLHGKLHHATKFQAVMWFLQFHLSGPSLSWKNSKFHGTHKKWLIMAILSSDLRHGTMHYSTNRQANSWNP